MIQDLRKNATFLFLFKAIILYVVWDFFYHYYLNNTFFADQLSWGALMPAIYAMDLFGYDADFSTTYKAMLIDKFPIVYMANGCNGLDFMGVFMCLVFAYPAKISAKVWFLPIGLVAIHILNNMRIVLLALNVLYWKETFDFNHKFTFILVVYGLIFLLWVTWAKKYTIVANPSA
jgi:exosortase family protein XrtF